MKFLRFKTGKVENRGALVDGKVRKVQGSIFDEYVITDEVYSPEDIEFLPPILPSKVVCVARNYAEHAKELGNDVPDSPMLFIKPSTSVNAHNSEVIRPKACGQLDYEGELGVVIGTKCKNVKPEHVKDFIFGYTVLNDFTARDIQKKEGKFTRAKGYDTFCPMGPYIETDMDWRDVRIITRVDGDVRQDGTVDAMIFDVEYLISFISEIMTLLPGDVIATGTPSGVGPVEPGQKVEVEIPGIGVLCNVIRQG